MELRDFLPSAAREFIRDRLIAGVADAEALFDLNAADEDSLTGALGQSISRHRPITFTSGDRDFRLRTYHRKLRGRGPGAPEKPLGADGIFQIDIEDETGQKIWQKGLPFQSKKEWSGSDSGLVGQAQKMIAEAGQGLVIDYTAEGYKACPANMVVEHQGRASVLRELALLRPLGHVLGDDFLNCIVGVEGLYFDPSSETFQWFGDIHLIGTSVRRSRPRR